MAENTPKGLESLQRTGVEVKEITAALKASSMEAGEMYKTLAAINKILELHGEKTLSNSRQLKELVKMIKEGGLKSYESFSKSYKSMSLLNESLAEMGKMYQALSLKSEEELESELRRNSIGQEFLLLLEDQHEIQKQELDTQLDFNTAYDKLHKIQKDFYKTSEKLTKEGKIHLDTTKVSASTYAKIQGNIQNIASEFIKLKNADPELLSAQPALDLINQVKDQFGGAITELQGNLEQTKFNIGGIEMPPSIAISTLKKQIPRLQTEIQNAINKSPGRIELAKVFNLDPSIIDKMVEDLSSRIAGIPSPVQFSEEEFKKINASIRKLRRSGQAEGALYSLTESANAQIGLIAVNEELSGMTAQLDRVTKYRPKLDVMMEGVHQGVLKLRNSVNQFVPDWMSEMLQLQNIVEGVGASAANALQVAAKSMAAGESGIVAMTRAAGALRTSLMGVLGPFALIAIAIAAIVGTLRAVEGSTKEIATQLGVSRKAAFDIYKQSLALGSSLSNNFVTQESTLDVMKQHKELYGTILDLSTTNAKSAVEFASMMGHQFGIAAGQIYQVTEQFKTLGANQEVAEGLTAYLATASELAGVSFESVTKDLVEAADVVALHFKGVPKLAARAAVQIRRLGMSLKDVGGIMDKSLNISGFMQDMTELNIMTQGSANLSRFFDLRFRGASPDVLAKEIADQYDNMVRSGQDNEFTMRKFAAMSGMSVEQLQKGYKVRQMSAALDEKQRVALEKHLDQLSDEDLANAAIARKKANQLDSQDRMAAAWEKIKAALIEALLPLAEVLSDILPSIAIAFKMLVIPLKVIGALIQGFMAPIKFIVDLIRDGWAPASQEVANTFGNIDESLSGWGYALAALKKAIIAIGGIWGAAWAFNKLRAGFSAVRKFLFGTAEAVQTVSTTMAETTKAGGGMFGRLKGWAESFKGSLEGVAERIKELFTGKKVDTTQLEDKAKKIRESFTGSVKPLSRRRGGSVAETVQEQVSGKMNEPGALAETATAAERVKPQSGANVKEFLTNLADGLKAMGSGKVLLGALNLIPTSVGFIAMIPGMVGVKLMSAVRGDSLRTSLTGIADGLKAMASGQVVAGAGALVLASAGFVAMIPGVVGLKLISMVAPSASVGLKLLGEGLSAFGKALLPYGLLALAAITGAAIGLGFALKLAAPAIEAFAPVIESLGNAIKSALGGVAEVVRSVGDVMVNMFSTLGSLNPIQLFAVAGGLTAVSAALVGFGAGTLVAGLSNFLAGDPIKKLTNLAALGAPLSVTAQAVKSISDSVRELAISIDAINLDKLSSVANNMSKINLSSGLKSLLSFKKETPAQQGPTGLDVGASRIAPPAPIGMSSDNTRVASPATPAGPLAATATPSGTERKLGEVGERVDRILATQPPPAPAPASPGAPDNAAIAATLRRMLAAMDAYANRPVVVRIGDMELRGLNRNLKVYNNAY